MTAFKKVSMVVSALLLSLALVPHATAQTVSNPAAAVTMSFDVASSVTVTATPGAITFTATDASHAAASGPITVVTTWNLAAGGHNVFTDAYFTSPTDALTGGSFAAKACARRQASPQTR